MVFDPQSRSSQVIKNISQLQNDQQQAIAELQFQNNLLQSNFDGGLFTIYRDNTNIASTNNITLSTLTGGDSQGKAELAAADPFDITTASFTQTFDAQNQDGVVLSVRFNNDGTKMYITGGINDKVFEYNLTNGFDVSTASFSQSFSFINNIDPGFGIAFNGDGTKMFISGTVSGEDGVAEFSLSTGFDVSTASFNQSINSNNFNISVDGGITFNGDGTKMFLVGGTAGSADVSSFDLSTGFDISTASFNQRLNLTTPSNVVGATGIAFNGDGTKMFVAGETNDNASESSVFEFALSTGFDLSTVSKESRFSVAPQEKTIEGVTFKPDGSKMYVTGSENDTVFEYDLASGFFSSGSVTLESKDLSLEENGGFDSPPSSAIVSQDASVGSGEDLTYTLRDGNGKAVTVTQSEVDTKVDTGNFTSTVVEVEVNLSQTGGTTPTSDDVSVLFQE